MFVKQVVHHNYLLQFALKMSVFSTSASVYTLMPLANSTFNNRVTQSGLLSVDVVYGFSSSMNDLKMHTIGVE